MEEGTCAHCGARFRLNPRARRIHHFCSKAECQRERRRRAQKLRRVECPLPSTATSRKEWAARMQAYRQAHPDFQEHERVAALERRLARRDEAGSSDTPATVYLSSGPGAGVTLRVVGEAGKSVTIHAEGASVLLPAS